MFFTYADRLPTFQWTAPHTHSHTESIEFRKEREFERKMVGGLGEELEGRIGE